MSQKDEETLLKGIRVVPLVVLTIGFLSAWLIFEHSSNGFEQRLRDIERSSLTEKRQQLKREVERVSAFIQDERRSTLDNIKTSLLARTNEALAVIHAIQSSHPNLAEKEVRRLASEAIRPIRFNNGRGYFFIYETTGMSVMHPILTEFQGQNMWDFQDTKGELVIQQLSDIALKKQDAFLTWWWRKPDDLNNEYLKVGYSKLFEPFDWFVGTGEYVLDYEQELKARLLQHINKIQHSNGGLVFVIDQNGNYLGHQPDYCKPHCNMPVSQLEYFADDGGFVYLNPQSESAKKLAFGQLIEEWNWTVMTLFNQSELDSVVQQRQREVNQDNNQERLKMITVTLLLGAILLSLSLVYSKQIASRFNRYKSKVEHKSKQLKVLNKSLESKVAKRTEELEKSLSELQHTQNELVESQKMAGLVGLVNGVAHELNTPLGVALSMVSLLESDMRSRCESLSESEKEQFTASFNLLKNNVDKAILLVQNFKALSIQDEFRQVESFNLAKTVADTIALRLAELNEQGIHCQLSIPSELDMTSDKASLLESLNQLVSNTCAHAFGDDGSDKQIRINAREANGHLILTYQDNGCGVDAQTHERMFEPFFTTKRGSKNTGLGLPIIYNHVTHRLNGALEVEKNGENGLAINLILPILLVA